MRLNRQPTNKSKAATPHRPAVGKTCFALAVCNVLALSLICQAEPAFPPGGVAPSAPPPVPLVAGAMASGTLSAPPQSATATTSTPPSRPLPPIQPGVSRPGRLRPGTPTTIAEQRAIEQRAAEQRLFQAPNLQPPILATRPATPKLSAATPAVAAPGKSALTTPDTPGDTAQKQPPSTDSNDKPASAAPEVLSPGPASTTELSPELLRLREKIHRVLSIYEHRQQNTRDNNCWEVMHAFVAFNSRTQIRRNHPQGEPVNAIGWLLWGQRCQGQPILTLQNGQPHAEIGVGVQGHPGQLLAILAQSRVSLETPLKIQGRDFTLRDLLEAEKRDCRPNTELTFRLIAFSHYLDLNETWRSSDGQEWSIPRLIQEELKAPIRGAACGGCHRLFGLTYAYQQRIKRGEPLDGEYAKAKKYIEEYQRYAWSIMNPDGSFSTNWFWRGENRPDVDRKIQTTGHVYEWLIIAQSPDELQSERMQRGIDFLAEKLLADPRHNWKLGPLGHALHALIMYDERVFGQTRWQQERLAMRPAPAVAGVLERTKSAPGSAILSPPTPRANAGEPIPQEVNVPQPGVPSLQPAIKKPSLATGDPPMANSSPEQQIPKTSPEVADPATTTKNQDVPQPMPPRTDTPPTLAPPENLIPREEESGPELSPRDEGQADEQPAK
ncbi:MAG: hypothetical protein SFX18_05575 [Pirellulales bacterium]|nr:hypothetical protein [Pirellulales bacterium]